MKIKLMMFLLTVGLLLPLKTIAETNKEEPFVYWATKPIQCGTMESIITLMKRYEEIPAIVLDGLTQLPNGMTSPSKFVFATNPKTQTWTLIEFVNPEQACILGIGKGDISFGNRIST